MNMADLQGSGSVYEERKNTANELLPGLRAWQIFFLLASVVIGEGIFAGDRAALEVAGPGGTLIALLTVGLLAISVMGCVSELVQLFPVPNAIVRYIEAFVDADLAWCCGIAYWYTWTAVFVALYYTAVNLMGYWQLNDLWKNIILVISPLVIFGINLMSVDLFGLVETVGGLLKIALVIGVAIPMYYLHASSKLPHNPTYIYDGIQAKNGVVPSDSRFAAFLYIIPIMAYSFLGVESITVMVFEACDVQSLRNPSRYIAWFILGIYAFCLIGELLIFSWQDENLPQIYQSQNIPLGANSGKLVMAVIAAEQAGYYKLATLINIGCVYSAFSASNSALYIASRTLYGLARRSRHHDTPLSRMFAGAGRTTHKTRVPLRALFLSMMALVWIPFLSNLDSVELFFDILLTTSSVVCLIVWAALCFSLLRFRLWFEKCRDKLDPGYERFDPKLNHPEGAVTGLMFLQPWLAGLGFVTSLFVVIILAGAPLWVHPSGGKFAIAYIAPIVLLILWGARKVWARRTRHSPRGWVTIDADPNPLMETLTQLRCGIPDRSSIGWPEFVEQHPWATGLARVWPSRRAGLRRRPRTAAPPHPTAAVAAGTPMGGATGTTSPATLHGAHAPISETLHGTGDGTPSETIQMSSSSPPSGPPSERGRPPLRPTAHSLAASIGARVERSDDPHDRDHHHHHRPSPLEPFWRRDASDAGHTSRSTLPVDDEDDDGADPDHRAANPLRIHVRPDTSPIELGPLPRETE